MNILITGCCGFIGSHLCEALLKNNENIWGIDNMNNYYDPILKYRNLSILKKYNNFKFFEDDLVTTKIIENNKFDLVINIGAMAGVRYSLENPEIYFKTNVEGQTHLLNECSKYNVKKYIYASSSSVYGCNQKIPFSESDPLNNINSPYACSKACGELIAKLYNRLYGISTIGLRFFTVYGPRGRPDMAPYKFINNIKNENPIDKYGEGDTYRDYTYIDNIIESIVKIIYNQKNNECEIFNIGNGNPINLNDFIKTCEDITNKKAIINKLPDQKGDVPKTFADCSKLENKIGKIEKITIKEGLKKYFETL